MKKIVIALSLTAFSAAHLQAAAEPKEPTGAARDAQYKKATEWCRNHFSEFTRSSEVVARWETHRGKTGWFCGI